MPVKKNAIKKTSKKTVTKNKTIKTKAKRTTKKRGGAYPVAFSASDVNSNTLLSPHTQDHLVASTVPSAIMVPSSTMMPPTMMPPTVMPPPTMMPPSTMMPSDGGMMDGCAKKRKKRKAGPYALFVKKQFSKVKKNNPSWKALDCMKEIAKMWKAQKNN